MAFVLESSTKPAVAPFNLFGLSCAIRNDFLNIMPLKEISILRKGSDIIKSLSNSRGEIVENLIIQTDTDEKNLYCGCTRFSVIMNRRFNTTPLNVLEVVMGPDICPEVLLSKMDGQYYTKLFLLGKYDWKDVVAFLHAGVKTVRLDGYMSLPAENMEEFIYNLYCSNVNFVWLDTDNYKDSWLSSAEKIFFDACIDAEYVSYEEARYCPEVIVTIGDRKIRIVGNNFIEGSQLKSDSGDSDEEEEYDEFY